MSTATNDPLRRSAELVAGDSGPAVDALERRLKRNAFDSIGRVKPQAIEGRDFETEAMPGSFFEDLSPPLQGIAIARSEGMLAFYNRVGWHPDFLDEPLDGHVPEEGLQPLTERYHARTLHDLGYVHPKHFEKMLGKAGAAALWENLGRYARSLGTTGTGAESENETDTDSNDIDKRNGTVDGTADDQTAAAKESDSDSTPR